MIPLARNLLFEKVPDAVLVLDTEKRIVDCNSSAKDLLNIHNNDYGHVVDGILTHWPEFLEQCCQTGYFEIEKKIHDTNRYYSIYVNDIYNDLLRLGTMCIIRDITDDKHNEDIKKQAMTNLTESEAKFRNISRMLRLMNDNVPDMIWAKDLQNRYIFTNRALCRTLLNATDTDEPLGKTDLYFADRERTKNPDNKNWHTFHEIGGDSAHIVKLRRKALRFDESGYAQGKFLYIDIYIAPLLDEEGIMIGTVGCGRDVTRERLLQMDNKEIAKKLEEKTLRLQAILRSLPDLLFVINKKGVFKDYYSPNDEKLLLPPDDVIGSTLFDIFPDKTAKEHLDAFRRCLKNGTVQTVNYQAEIDSDPHYFEARVSPLDAENVLAIIRDETDKVRLSNEIRDKMKFQTLIMDLAAGFVNNSIDNLDNEIDNALKEIGMYTRVDRVYIFDYDFQKGLICNTYEWCAKGISPEIDNLQAIPLDYVPEWVETHRRGDFIVIPDVGELHEDDSVRTILEPQRIQSLITIPLMDNNRCLGFVGFDSVRQKRNWTDFEKNLLKIFAEFLTNLKLKLDIVSNLKNSEERYRLLAENVSDIISLYDRNNCLVYISPSCRMVTGYDADYLKKTPLTDLMHPEDRDSFNNSVKMNTEDKKEFATYTFRFKHRNGKYIWIEAISNRQYDKKGDIKQIVVISRDITRRKDDEQKILKSLQEKEILLREIHHRVKNNLNVVASLLKLQSRRITTKKEAIKAFQNSSDRVMSMALAHQKLYNEDDFDNIDMSHYLDSLIRQLKGIWNPDPNIKIINETQNIPLTITLAIPLGLILNELITNALKYAFPKGRKGTIRIAIRQFDHDYFEMRFADDGIGLSDSIKIEHAETLGLHLVHMLSQQMRGTLTVSRDKGTVFTLILHSR